MIFKTIKEQTRETKICPLLKELLLPRPKMWQSQSLKFPFCARYVQVGISAITKDLGL